MGGNLTNPGPAIEMCTSNSGFDHTVYVLNLLDYLQVCVLLSFVESKVDYYAEFTPFSFTLEKQEAIGPSLECVWLSLMNMEAKFFENEVSLDSYFFVR